MNAKNGNRKFTSSVGIIQAGIPLGLTVILFIALLGLVSTPALAHGHGRTYDACGKTSWSALIACQNEARDDYYITRGNCYNLSEAEDREDCKDEATGAFEEAKEECKDVFEARQDLCEELGKAPYDPEIEPDDFVDPANIGGSVAPNPYFPLVTGNTWVYEGDGETITVVVTDETINILGVTCVVVTDVVTDDEGEELEVTQDWFAQDGEGNVWYFGENSLAKVECDDEDAEACEGLFTEDGSWKAGFEYAKPGILIKRYPEVDDIYRQEFALGEAEDWAKVVSVNAEGEVDGYSCADGDNCLQTEEGAPLEPDVTEFKYYKPGIGLILEVNAQNTDERVELKTFTPGP